MENRSGGCRKLISAGFIKALVEMPDLAGFIDCLKAGD
jgi:hypothetical protein